MLRRSVFSHKGKETAATYDAAVCGSYCGSPITCANPILAGTSSLRGCRIHSTQPALRQFWTAANPMNIEKSMENELPQCWTPTKLAEFLTFQRDKLPQATSKKASTYHSNCRNFYKRH